jgi:hypothetical protein
MMKEKKYEKEHTFQEDGRLCKVECFLLTRNVVVLQASLYPMHQAQHGPRAVEFSGRFCDGAAQLHGLAVFTTSVAKTHILRSLSLSLFLSLSFISFFFFAF